jgi:type IV secretory pathway TraG/TraD family ATPase VirD4
VCTFVLDEAPNVAPIPEMPLLLSDGGGRGMPAWLFAQSFGQLRARWGRDEADTMWGSSPIKVILGGASETDDLERLSRLMGERRVHRVSTSRSHGSGWSRQTSTEKERVLPVHAIRQLDVGQALLLYRSLPPAVVDLTPWWDRKDADAFRSVASTAPPKPKVAMS